MGMAERQLEQRELQLERRELSPRTLRVRLIRNPSKTNSTTSSLKAQLSSIVHNHWERNNIKDAEQIAQPSLNCRILPVC